MIALAGRLLALAGPKLAKLATASPQVLSRIAARISIPAGKDLAKRIGSAALKNKLALAYTLYELYGVGDDLLKSMTDEDPEIAQAVSRIDYKSDTDPEDRIKQGSSLDDEYDVILSAVNVVGSFDRLVALRAAIGIPSNVYAAYQADRDRGRRLR